MAHTPGPWRVGKAINGNWIEAGHAVAQKSIARTFYNDVGAETEDANARLIASAPDLLDACAAAEDYLAASQFEGAQEIYQQLHTAIARAKGE